MSRGLNGWDGGPRLVRGGEAEAPAECRELALALGRLGEAERAAAPAALEDRIFVRTRGMLARPGPSRATVAAPRPTHGPSRAAMRLAASVALAAAVGAAWLATRRGEADAPAVAAGATPYADLFLVADLEEELDPLDAEIDVLLARTTALEAAWPGDWAGLDLLSDEEPM